MPTYQYECDACHHAFEILQSMTEKKLQLLDIFSYSCMNCLRSLECIKQLDSRYRKHGLETIIIHPPEWAFEKDSRNILQALAEWGPVENDTVMLTEYVRAALKRYISHKYTRGQSTLIVYLLDPQIEETVRSSVQHTSSGSYLALEPEITQEILAAVRNEVGNLPPSAQQPVVLTTMEIRRYFRKLVELEFPHLAVLSYQELSPEMNIQPIARISLG